MANTKETAKKNIWECVSSILNDYGINTVNISNRVGAHLIGDMLDSLITEGYLSISNNNNKEEDNG